MGVFFSNERKDYSKKTLPQQKCRGRAKKIPGGVLLSHPAAQAVPSAQKGLTDLFKIRTGVAPSPLPSFLMSPDFQFFFQRSPIFFIQFPFVFLFLM